MTSVFFKCILDDRLMMTLPVNASDIHRIASEILERLSSGRLAVLVKLSRLNANLADKQGIAQAVVEAFASSVRETFGLDDISCEFDRPQRCDQAPGQRRTLLPHHDGGHCSFLTPPSSVGILTPRSLPNKRFTTTDEHKIYQGLFLTDIGSGMSATSYFDLVRIVTDAYIFQHGAAPTLPQLTYWYGVNLNEALLRPGLGYLPIGAQIGAKGIGCEVPIHVWSDNHRIGDQQLSTAVLADDMTTSALGCDFQTFMERYAVLAHTESGDLLMGHNLFAWHGGVEGGNGREIHPMCVTGRSSGNAYERWLELHWERFFDVSPD